MAGLLYMTARANAAYATLGRVYSPMVMATILAKAQLIALEKKATRVGHEHLMAAIAHFGGDGEEH